MKKDILILCLVVVLVIFLVNGTKIQSVEDYYLTHLDDIQEDSETVFLVIECRTILDNYDKLDVSLRDEKYLPNDGYILVKTEYVLRDGDTVFDILKRVTRHHKIKLDYVYSLVDSSTYITGINHLVEFSCGELSGWQYFVNGQSQNIGCDSYILSDGDLIEWRFTCDLGRDLVGDDSEIFTSFFGENIAVLSSNLPFTITDWRGKK